MIVSLAGGPYPISAYPLNLFPYMFPVSMLLGG